MRSYFDKLSRKTIAIRNVCLRQRGDVAEVSASVAGVRIWFRARGVALRPDALAFLTAYFVSSQTTGRRLRCEQRVPLSRRAHFGKIARLLSEWWGLNALPEIGFGRDQPPGEEAGTRTGAFFSCGVDSFDTLLERGEAIDDLILIHGFDVELSDTERFAALRAQAEAFAEQTGKRLIVVETNLREHRIFGRGSWTRNHGAALATVGQLLADEVGTLLVSASYPSDALQPWGSHPLLDHLWSSTGVKIEHVGDERWRYDKIEQHGAHPLVQAHLSVCWKAKGIPLNCGTCEKCVRNQLAFLLSGHPIPATFPVDVDLAVALRGIPRIQAFSNIYALALQSEVLPEAIKAEIQLLVERSGLANEVVKPTGLHGWDDETVTARIADAGERKRHEGGSPNAEEVEAYAACLPPAKSCAEGTAVVLGMTPELRRMAVGRFKRVIVVDKGAVAIKRYRDWMPETLKPKEKIYAVDWSHLPYIDWSGVPPVRAVFGDGIFGNIPDMTAQHSFLLMLRGLFPQAALIFRKALARQGFSSDQEALHDLRQAYREGRIGADEFGFCVRLQGFLHDHFDPDTYILDNAALFERCDRLHVEGFFDTQEMEAIQHFRFGKPNCLLTEESWEQMLAEQGFSFEKTVLQGKRWYAFYPVYHLRAGSA